MRIRVMNILTYAFFILTRQPQNLQEEENDDSTKNNKDAFKPTKNWVGLRKAVVFDMDFCTSFCCPCSTVSANYQRAGLRPQASRIFSMIAAGMYEFMARLLNILKKYGIFEKNTEFLRKKNTEFLRKMTPFSSKN